MKKSRYGIAFLAIALSLALAGCESPVIDDGGTKESGLTGKNGALASEVKAGLTEVFKDNYENHTFYLNDDEIENEGDERFDWVKRMRKRGSYTSGFPRTGCGRIPTATRTST